MSETERSIEPWAAAVRTCLSEDTLCDRMMEVAAAAVRSGAIIHAPQYDTPDVLRIVSHVSLPQARHAVQFESLEPGPTSP